MPLILEILAVDQDAKIEIHQELFLSRTLFLSHGAHTLKDSAAD